MRRIFNFLCFVFSGTSILLLIYGLIRLFFGHPIHWTISGYPVTPVLAVFVILGLLPFTSGEYD